MASLRRQVAGLVGVVRLKLGGIGREDSVVLSPQRIIEGQDIAHAAARRRLLLVVSN